MYQLKEKTMETNITLEEQMDIEISFWHSLQCGCGIG